MRKVVMMGLMVSIISCTSLSMTLTAQSGASPKDGELQFPTDYKSYPSFLKGVQKPNAVRDLYINPAGAKAHHGESFANDSILVMEIYNAKKGADGNFTKGADGKLLKDGLAKVYIMQKGAGWGHNAPKGLRNGDWIFSAFTPNGDRLDVNYSKCRSCHLPLGDTKDYVHRYDEYFQTRNHTH